MIAEVINELVKSQASMRPKTLILENQYANQNMTKTHRTAALIQQDNTEQSANIEEPLISQDSAWHIGKLMVIAARTTTLGMCAEAHQRQAGPQHKKRQTGTQAHTCSKNIVSTFQ